MPLSVAEIQRRLTESVRNAKKIQDAGRALSVADAQQEQQATPSTVQLIAPPPSPLREPNR